MSGSMDECIVRGGISHVLSQARASLKNPSRPFTPRTSARPLFNGDDYRPGSRPSSSNSTVPEIEQYKHTTSAIKLLPPRATPEGTSAKTNLTSGKRHPTPVASRPKPKEVSAPKTQEVPAPMPVDESNEDPLDSTPLELPSTDHLVQQLELITTEIDAIVRLPTDAVASKTAFDGLATLLSTFSTSCASYALSTKSSVPSDNLASIRRQLLDALTTLALDHWSESSSSARGLLVVTPSILELYMSDPVQDPAQEDAVIACGKKLFVLSKDSANDYAFCSVRYVESVLALLTSVNRTLLSASTKLSNHYPMKLVIYLTGTLKNISNGSNQEQEYDKKMLTLLATNGAIALLSDTLQWRSTVDESKEMAQCLIQTTSILRNLSAATLVSSGKKRSSKTSYLKQFNEHHVASRLCAMIPAYRTHHELMVNVSRILGKLTLHEASRSQVNSDYSQHVQNLFQLVNPATNPSLSFMISSSEGQVTSTHDVLLVRMYFVLGNLCASNDRNRAFLGLECRAVSPLLQALTFYCTQYTNESTTTKLSTSHDVLVKLVRLVANMAIHAEVGSLMITSPESTVGLTALLEALECAQQRHDEELMLNIVSTWTNLSYYTSTTKVNFVETNRLQLATQLAQILWDPNEEAVVEATRAFGNLSRFTDVLAYMRRYKVIDCLVILLDHSHREIVCTVCGVLMNAALDASTRSGLCHVRAISSEKEEDATWVDARTLLVGILQSSVTSGDVELSCMAAKVLYNLMLSSSNEHNEEKEEKDEDDDWSSPRQYLSTVDGQTMRRVVRETLGKLENVHPRRNSTRARGRDTDDEEDEDVDTHATTAHTAQLCEVLTQLHRSIDRH